MVPSPAASWFRSSSPPNYLQDGETALETLEVLLSTGSELASHFLLTHLSHLLLSPRLSSPAFPSSGRLYLRQCISLGEIVPQAEFTNILFKDSKIGKNGVYCPNWTPAELAGAWIRSLEWQ